MKDIPNKKIIKAQDKLTEIQTFRGEIDNHLTTIKYHMRQIRDKVTLNFNNSLLKGCKDKYLNCLNYDYFELESLLRVDETIWTKSVEKIKKECTKQK